MGYWDYIIEQGWWAQVLLLIGFLLYLIWFLRRVKKASDEAEKDPAGEKNSEKDDYVSYDTLMGHGG